MSTKKIFFLRLLKTSIVRQSIIDIRQKSKDGIKYESLKKALEFLKL
jgi:hypothetical protein